MLKPLYDFELQEKVEDVFGFRLMCEDAKAELKELIGKIDAHLIAQMKEKGISEFKMQLASGINKICYGKKKVEKVIGAEQLQKMLFSDNEAERELSRKALAGGASAWKTAQVKILADTLGLTGLVETTWKEEIELKVIPVEMLEKQGKI